MTIREYLSKMKNIQSSLLKYIDEESYQVINLSYLMQLLDDLEIRNNKYDLSLFLHLLSSIANYHHRGPDFFAKIEKILKKLRKDILYHFSNREIFNIFKNNKRVLLFLFKSEMIVMDKPIASIITENDYRGFFSGYFFNQIRPFISEKKRREISKKIPFLHEELQKVGENEQYIYELIRKDQVNEFISYTKKHKIKLDSEIDESIYETNQFLIDKSFYSLIEYAAFFGSVKIVKYLHNKVELDESLWLFAIHGRNIKLINFLKEKNIELTDETYKKCFIESIKCHHDDMLEILEDIDFKKVDKSAFLSGLEFYNFNYLQSKKIKQSALYNFCEYDYCFFVNELLKDIDTDINNPIIYN